MRLLDVNPGVLRTTPEHDPAGGLVPPVLDHMFQEYASVMAVDVERSRKSAPARTNLINHDGHALYTEGGQQ